MTQSSDCEYFFAGDTTTRNNFSTTFDFGPKTIKRFRFRLGTNRTFLESSGKMSCQYIRYNRYISSCFPSCGGHLLRWRPREQPRLQPAQGDDRAGRPRLYHHAAGAPQPRPRQGLEPAALNLLYALSKVGIWYFLAGSNMCSEMFYKTAPPPPAGVSIRRSTVVYVGKLVSSTVC